MYQPPRSSGRTSSLSAANSSRTNPLRSNNDREEPSERARSTVDATNSPHRSVGDSGSDLSGSQSEGQDSRDMQLLNQIIQQFFAKGALIVVSSRIAFPKFVTKNGNVKQNKWFSIVQDDSEELFEKTVSWRTLQIEDGAPSPMTIEIYLDLKDLTKSQSLVILDEQGKRWDVADFLGQLPSNTRQNLRSTQLVLERWEFALENPIPIGTTPLSESLPNIYKRCIPVVRSLLSTSMLLPAWKYFRRLSKAQAAHTSNPSLKLKYRIINGSASKSMDSLTCPLYPGQQNVTGNYAFGSLNTPAGQLQASVVYRTNCEFRVDDSEALLSSHFMGMDDIYFKPSLGRQESQIVGSAPTSKKGTERLEEEDSPDRSQTYGSLSTFHGGGTKMSSSPMTALRNMSQADQPSPGTTPAQRPIPSPRTQTRPLEGRRVSISFQPFKAGSLASSPGKNMPLSPSRPSIQPLTHRSKNSLTTLPQAILRTPNITSDTAVASSTSSSPKPAPINRYSSSFSHRRSRLSSGASRGDEEVVGSSGRGSPASSAQQQQPESDSVQKTDDESLQDFLKFIEQKKDLTLSSKESASQAGLRTTAALAKYRGMKDSARELSDSLSSSLAMRGTAGSSATTSSSRAPAIIPGTSLRDIPMGSIGSSISPSGKPISPHAAHTPAVPSRLSANSVVDDDVNDVTRPEPKRSRSRLRPDSRSHSQGKKPQSVDDGKDAKSIPIPTSPLPWSYGRRASSVRPSAAPAAEDDDPEQEPFNLQSDISQSLPEERNEQLSLNDEPPSAEDSTAQIPSPNEEAESEEQLAAFEAPAEFSQRRGSPFRLGARSRGSTSGRALPASPIASGVHVVSSRATAQTEGEEYSPASSSMGVSGSVQASSAMASASGSYRRSAHHRGGSGIRSALSGRSQQSQNQDDDGELMFTMSELGSARRSLEDARSNSNTASGSGRVNEGRRGSSRGERQG